MKILVSGEIQRPTPQIGNILRLWNILKLRWPDASVLTDSKNKMTPEEWKGAIDGEPGDEMEIVRAAKEGDFGMVVGFELCKRATDQLEAAGIDWVNSIIHPIRYGPDLLFGAKTNRRELPFNTVSMRQWEHTFRCWALLEKARNARNLQQSDNFAVIIGQVPRDKNCTGVNFVEIAVKLEGEFKKLTPMVFFKHHPKADFQDLPVSAIENNTYELLSHPNCVKVGGWNSSVLYEAQFFDVPTQQLGPSWWEGFVPITLSQLVGYNLPDGALRRIVQDTWGYRS
jgi:hypothetical protein